jgi:hypothetical protein
VPVETHLDRTPSQLAREQLLIAQRDGTPQHLLAIRARPERLSPRKELERLALWE